MSRRVVNSLQAGRAIAALAVVVHHATAYTLRVAPAMPSILEAVGSYGYLGVDFFFVLSGFIIYHTRTEDWRLYAKSRLARVYIPYLPVGIGLGLAYLLLPNLSAATRDWNWLATITLLPGSGEPSLIVAWTLQYELAFYLVFGLGIALGRPVVTVAVACLIAILATPAAVGLLTIEFLFGVIAAKAVEDETPIRALVWSAISIACFVIFGATPEVRTLFGLAMGFVVIVLVRAEQRGAIKTPAALLFLGAASYSIYLTHNPVMAVTTRFFDNWVVALVACLIVGTLSGIAYHLVIEAPTLRRLKPGPAAGLEGQE